MSSRTRGGMLDFKELHLQVIHNPPVIICLQCHLAFTTDSIYAHMLETHNAEDCRDAFQATLRSKNISGHFELPSQPIHRLPGIPVIQGILCQFPTCSQIFVTPESLVGHTATSHPGTSPQDGISCELQEVEDSDDRTLRFRVIAETSDVSGKYPVDNYFFDVGY
jgi:hypothetical protein